MVFHSFDSGDDGEHIVMIGWKYRKYLQQRTFFIGDTLLDSLQSFTRQEKILQKDIM